MLEKRWRDMTPSDWDDFLKRYGIYFNDALGERSGGRRCSLREESTWCRLSISPVPNAAELSLADITENGVVLAVVRNEGWLKETTLNMSAGQEAYWVAYRVSMNPAAYEAVLVDFHEVGVALKTLPFHACPPMHTGAAETHASFRWCEHYSSADSARGRIHTAQWRGTHIHTSPPWLTCVDGCCSSDS